MGGFDIALIGGDERITYMQPYLLEHGYRTAFYGVCPLPEEGIEKGANVESLKEALQAPRIVVGIPFLKNGKVFAKQGLQGLQAEDLLHGMKEGQTLFGGVFPEGFVDACKEKGIVCRDFMKEEALAVFNAIATAEGAILEALLHQKTNLHGSRCLVLGYGRCGRVLAGKLKGLDAKVTVCARRNEVLANADAFGLDTLNLSNLEEKLQDFELIFNTVPAVLLEEKRLRKMQRDVLIIDIASAPGGVDVACAEGLGIRHLFCPGLPGKYAPKTAAKGLVEYVVKCG